jgi:membrane-bound lytic murein transglycosylase C
MSSGYTQTFEEYISENQKGVNEQQRQFDSYQKAYLAEYEQYKGRIQKEWDEARITSPKQWVSYSEDMKTRTTVDYESNTVEVAIRDDAQPTVEKIQKEVKRALTTNAKTATEQDPILSKVQSQASFSLKKLLMSGVKLAKDTVNKVMTSASMKLEADSHGSFKVTTVKLPEAAKTERVRQLFPFVKKYSKKYDISPPLILAIIKTESAFNPLAQSHIPAFGLMQIVPGSAGKDVQRFVYKKDRKPSSKMLFNPEVNIEHGVAYLHLLKNRYLKGIKDKQSLEFCAIAAYNTGAGNVAWAFNRTTNIKKAISDINSMTSEQVYTMLRKNLKYEEARKYLLKVRKNKQLYMI